MSQTLAVKKALLPEGTPSENLPIYVSLDGAILQTNLLHEVFLQVSRANVLFPFQLLKGVEQARQWAKHEYGKSIPCSPELFSFNHEVVAYLRSAREQQRRVYLVSDWNQTVSNAVADHLGVFDEVLTYRSDSTASASERLEIITAHAVGQKFEYLGDKDTALPNAIGQVSPVSRIRVAAKAMRLHQWLKNLLVFVPLLTSHRILSADSVIQAVIAFVAFGLCASGVYLVNDMVDLSADRAHPRKRNRPFASGKLPVAFGFYAVPVLFAAAASCAWLLPPLFMAVLACYLLTTFAYSLSLKRMVALDVNVLAGLYTLRIIGGAVAISVVLSFWLLTFSVFVFFCLALVKRYAELRSVIPASGSRAVAGRDYSTEDMHVVMSLGSASGCVSVLVLALYVHSADVGKLYSQPITLWPLCPLLLFWLTRVWMLANRGLMHDDPVVFAAKDRISHLVGAAAVTCLLFSAIG